VAGVGVGICPNKDLVVAAGGGPEVATVEAGAAPVDLAPCVNREGVDAAGAGAPNFSVGAADCAVVGGCEAAVLEGTWPKRFVVGAVTGVVVGVPKSVFCAEGWVRLRKACQTAWGHLTPPMRLQMTVLELTPENR
jgi:hypothetical protein